MNDSVTTLDNNNDSSLNDSNIHWKFLSSPLEEQLSHPQFLLLISLVWYSNTSSIFTMKIIHIAHQAIDIQYSDIQFQTLLDFSTHIWVL